MIVHITPEARQYLASRSQSLTIFLAELKVQCCVPYAPPEVRIGPPDAPDEYLPIASGDLTVYVPREAVEHQPELTIVLRGLGPFKTLGLQGWRAFGVVSL